MVSMITDPNLIDDAGYIYIADSDIKQTKLSHQKRFMRSKIYEEECLLLSIPISIVYMKDKDM